MWILFSKNRRVDIKEKKGHKRKERARDNKMNPITLKYEKLKHVQLLTQ